MPTVSVALNDAQFLVLKECARNRQLTVDQLVHEKFAEFLQTTMQSLSDGLNGELDCSELAKRQSEFELAAQQVLKKNEELYQRLAK